MDINLTTGSTDLLDVENIEYSFPLLIASIIFNWSFSLASFATITLPTWIYKLLSWSFTLQLNFTTLLIFFGLSFTLGYLVVRYRFHNKYSRLPVEKPQSQGPCYDLHPDVTGESEKPSKYPDEFLSMFLEGIKVFGYLEKPVFNELARHLQTKKLLTGDTLMLEKERSFYIVVDGHVQVFVKTVNEEEIALDPFESDDYNRGYQLLNEVTNGGTLSSLFTILSLFTEDIELRYPDTEEPTTVAEEKKDHVDNVTDSKNKSSEKYDDGIPPTNDQEGWKIMFSNLNTLDEEADNYFGKINHQKKPSRKDKTNNNTLSNLSSPPNEYSRPQILRKISKESLHSLNVHPNIIARATVDTTLAVIPSEAFHRLTENFPNSVAHIVQVILTRFQRVTFWTGYKYLGLTKDLLRTEKLMNDVASYGLPNDFFRPGSMERLRLKFVGSGTKYAREHHDDSDDMDMSDSGLINKNKKNRNNSRPRKTYESDVEFTVKNHLNNKGLDSSLTSTTTRYLSVPTKEHVKPTSGSPINGRDYDAEDDRYLRESVLEGISKGIGLLQPSCDDESISETISSVNSEIESDVEILFYPKGSHLVKEDERNVGLFFVIDGILDVYVTANKNDLFGSSTPFESKITTPIPLSAKSLHKKKESITNGPNINTRDRSLFMIKSGGIAGYLAALTGFPSFVNIRASTDTYVGFLSKASLNRLMEKNPTILLTLAKRLIKLLSPLINAGQVLYRKGDVSDSIYIVLSGRVRTINERESGVIDILGEYGKGQSVGELEVMTGTPRPYTLHAIRDTELARMPKTLFNSLALRHPEITLQISRIIAGRTHLQQELDCNIGNTSSTEFGKNNRNLKTVGILPVNGSVPVAEFASKLKNALLKTGESCILLNHASVVSALGKHAFNQIGRLKLINWLAEQEENARIVLYLADGGINSSWTQTCIRQADCILLVGLGDSEPSIGEYERILIGAKTTARKELVLLHSERNCSPGTTRQWLKNRLWIHAHHHVQMNVAKPNMLIEPSRKNTLLNIKDIKDQIQKYYPISYYPRRQKRSPAIYTGNRSDFARLARRLCGKSVGLVLGGGGARGIAHIGVIRALEEAGIPIDMIGGTSIGSFIGGLYARDSDNVAILGRAKAFASRMSSKWRQVFDLTYPVTAWFTGYEFNRGIWKSLYDTLIEDFWLSYFCVTTNITWSRMEVHQSGYAWRYIRASMSLSGFLPPICDNGNLLVDGGYMDNLPVGIMKSMGADTIIAVDVASHDDTSPVYYGDSLSGWWVLLNKFNPFSNQKIPSIADIQSRLAYVSSVKTLEEAKNTPGCLYMEMPVQQYGTLEFSKFDEIFEVGYKAGKELLIRWKAEENELEKNFYIQVKWRMDPLKNLNHRDEAIVCEITISDCKSFWNQNVTIGDLKLVKPESFHEVSKFCGATQAAFSGQTMFEDYKLSCRVTITENKANLAWRCSLENSGFSSMTFQFTLGNITLTPVSSFETEKLWKEWLNFFLDERQNLNACESRVSALENIRDQMQEKIEVMISEKLNAEAILMERFKKVLNAKKKKIRKLMKALSSNGAIIPGQGLDPSDFSAGQELDPSDFPASKKNRFDNTINNVPSTNDDIDNVDYRNSVNNKGKEKVGGSETYHGRKILSTDDDIDKVDYRNSVDNEKVGGSETYHGQIVKSRFLRRKHSQATPIEPSSAMEDVITDNLTNKSMQVSGISSRTNNVENTESDAVEILLDQL
ncbi:9517_t:CDS:10 [Entrophospora sp. SA101]|nr:9517_t:CDS:10 [Entrophospora sp. SA101]